MKGDAVLEYAEFQVNPSGTRYELLVSSNGVREKLASGLLNPFLTHLQAIEDRVSGGCKSVRLEYGNGLEDTHGRSWFTKGTLERFVRFVSTPDILESVKSIDDEMTFLKQVWTTRFKNYTQGKSFFIPSNSIFPSKDYNADSALLEINRSTDMHTTYSYDGVNLDPETSKHALLNDAMDARLISMQQELRMAFIRAAAAGFSGSSMDDLIAFSNYFGAHRLCEACCNFLGILKKVQLGSTNLNLQTLEKDSYICLSSATEIDVGSSCSSNMLMSHRSLTSTLSGLFSYESIGNVEGSYTKSKIGASESFKKTTSCDQQDQLKVEVVKTHGSISRNLSENKLVERFMSGRRFMPNRIKYLNVNNAIDENEDMETEGRSQNSIMESIQSFHMNEIPLIPVNKNLSSSWISPMDQHTQILMSIIDSQVIVDNNDYNLEIGRLYEYYRRIRYTKLMEKRDTKKFEREAKLTSMVEALMKEKEKMDAHVFKSSKKNCNFSCSGTVHPLKQCGLDTVMSNDRNTVVTSAFTPVSKGNVLIPKSQGLRKSGTFRWKGGSSPLSTAITLKSTRKSRSKSSRSTVSKDSFVARSVPCFDHVRKNMKPSHPRAMNSADVNTKTMASLKPPAVDEVGRSLKAKLNIAIGVPNRKEKSKSSLSARNSYAPKAISKDLSRLSKDEVSVEREVGPEASLCTKQELFSKTVQYGIEPLPMACILKKQEAPNASNVSNKKAVCDVKSNCVFPCDSSSAKFSEMQILEMDAPLCDKDAVGFSDASMNSNNETILEESRANNLSSKWDIQFQDPLSAKCASCIPNPPTLFSLREDQLTGSTMIKVSVITNNKDELGNGLQHHKRSSQFCLMVKKSSKGKECYYLKGRNLKWKRNLESMFNRQRFEPPEALRKLHSEKNWNLCLR